MDERKINMAVIGTGSCFSSLIQLIELSKSQNQLHGVMNEKIGPYSMSDIEVVIAIDVDKTKVGLDISEVIKSENVSPVIHHPIEWKDIPVIPGPISDGLDGKLSNIISPCKESHDISFKDVSTRLKGSEAEVVVCFLPTGSKEAVNGYAIASADAGCAFINCTPEEIANNHEVINHFINKGLPILGDDMRSHLGATTLHTALIDLVQSRGLKLENTYQLNFGGNTDFYNLSDDARSFSKKKTKKQALSAAGINTDDISAGPNGYIKFLNDTKLCFINLQCLSVLNSEVNIEVKLTVEDSPNSAGVMANAVRIAKVCLDIGRVGVIDEVCPFLFKNPREGMSDGEGLNSFRLFIDSIGEDYDNNNE